MAHHVLITYNDVKYRIPRGDKKEYEDAVEAIGNDMEDSA